jgi:NAD(P)-dependent dehydrogenase (short-subunit alcohol dehydrogenase family)
MSLIGKYALITGSSRGIGRGIALKLAEQGAKLAINYCRNEVAANDALAKVRGLGSDGFIVQGDVCRPDDIVRMFSRVKQEFGVLDIFVANARPEVPAFYQPPMEITLESWRTAIDSQATAFLVGAREASALFREGGTYSSYHLCARRTLWELAAMGCDGRRQVCHGMPSPLLRGRARTAKDYGQCDQSGLD